VNIAGLGVHASKERSAQVNLLRVRSSWLAGRSQQNRMAPPEMGASAGGSAADSQKVTAGGVSSSSHTRALIRLVWCVSLQSYLHLPPHSHTTHTNKHTHAHKNTCTCTVRALLCTSNQILRCTRTPYQGSQSVAAPVETYHVTL
jgi:hypothetical protein